MAPRVLLLVFVLAAVAVVVAEGTAEQWVPTFGTAEETKEKTEETAKDQAAQTTESAKTWTKWASDRFPAFVGASEKPASEAAGEGQEAARGAADTAKGYASAGAQHVIKTKDQLHKHASGLYSRWSSWAKDSAGKFYNPAKGKSTETAASLETASKEATDEEL